MEEIYGWLEEVLLKVKDNLIIMGDMNAVLREG